MSTLKCHAIFPWFGNRIQCPVCKSMLLLSSEFLIKEGRSVCAWYISEWWFARLLSACIVRIVHLWLTYWRPGLGSLFHAVVDLVRAMMSVIYQHLLSTRDMLVGVLLLQLVELRARNWQSDSSADQFYNSRHLALARQKVFLTADSLWCNTKPIRYA